MGMDTAMGTAMVMGTKVITNCSVRYLINDKQVPDRTPQKIKLPLEAYVSDVEA